MVGVSVLVAAGAVVDDVGDAMLAMLLSQCVLSAWTQHKRCCVQIVCSSIGTILHDDDTSRISRAS